MIGQQVQHYRIIRQLGAGGMGIVYEAEDTRLGRHVVLKFLPDSHGVSEESVERFLREARIASSLNHPNICTIHDVGVHEGRHFIAMELLEGESLRGRIHGHPLALQQILEVGCQLADALDAAHTKGIIHRDIKPANVFITKRGQAKLLDFGIAKLGEEVHDATAETRVAGDVLTTPGMAVGSINYMSPEQARGEELDARTDLFSLGLVLYEMATGREAFEGKTTAVVFDALLNRQPPDARQLNPQIPEQLQRVMTRALEKDRRMRYQTAADMLSELGRLRRDTTSQVVVSTSDKVVAVKTRAFPTWPVAAAALVVVGALVWFFGFRRSAPPLTEKDTLLVADFSNTTNDAVFDDALRQAVAVQLQQSPFITLLSDQRVQRTLRLMQRPPEEPVRGDIGREVCQRAGAKATVEGSIAPLGSNFVITLGVHNCQTGESIARQQVQASSKEDVLKELGVAVKGVREHLGESLASIGKYDVPVAEATTKSLEALRAYGQGIRARVTRGDAAAVPFFKEAVAKDPEFALAYAKLGVVLANTGEQEQARQNAAKAYEFRDKVSEYERLYINWNYAQRVQGDQKAAKDALDLLVGAYPRDFAARNNLGVFYNNNGEFEEALKQYQAATEIAPDEPGPISNAAYVLMYLGRYDEASANVDRALGMRPDGSLALARWMAARLNGSARTAEFEQVAKKFATPDQISGADAAMAAWDGRFKDYSRIQQELATRLRAAGNEDGARSVLISEQITRAIFLGSKEVEVLKAAAAKETEAQFRAQYASSLALLGDSGPARKWLSELEKNPLTAQSGTVSVIRAMVMVADGKSADGIAELQKALVMFPRAQELNFVIASIRERNGEIDDALVGYDKVVKSSPFLGANAIVSAARFSAAQLLIKKGDTAGAKAHLDVLLAQWKNADTEFKMLADAKALRASIK